MKRTDHAELCRAVRRGCAAALALGCVSLAHAGFSTAQSSSGWRIDWDSGTMQPSAQFMPASGTKAAGNTGYSIANGALQGSATGKLPLGSNVIDVTARVVPDKPSIGRAVGNFLFKVSWPLQVGVAAYDLLKELGLDASRDASGALQVNGPVDDGLCHTVGGCPGFTTNSSTPAKRTDAYRACLDSTTLQAGQTMTAANGLCTQRNAQGTIVYQFQYFATTVPYTSPPTMAPMTQQQLADKIASQSGWPTSSAFPEVVKQALESGETITAPSPTVTGPSTVQGPKSTTTEGGKTVEKQTVYNITYNNNNVSYTTTVTTVTTNPDGSKTTATETKEADKEPDECTKNPDSLNCADLDVPEGTIPKTTKNIVYTPESWFGGGSCPADKTMMVRGVSIKVWDWQASCGWLVQVFRPILLIMAGIAAMFIVLPRGDIG